MLEEAKADTLGACLMLIAGQNVNTSVFLNSFAFNSLWTGSGARRRKHDSV
jgi:hypothetical protein